MIDFRYHLVSIVAVFLALAVGIVLGSTELRGAALSALDRTSSALSTKLEAADNENNALQQQVQGDHQFAQVSEPVLLNHLLDSKRVVIITTPGAPASVVNGIRTGLSDAGATVSGQVTLSSKFADTSASNLILLSQLTQQATPAGLTLANGSPQQQAAQLLATALVSKNQNSSGSSGGNGKPGNTGSGNSNSGNSGSSGNGSITSQNAQTIVSSFSAGNFITVSGHPTNGATLAVIVTPATAPQDGNSDPANQAVVALAQEFGSGSQATVVAGPYAASGPGSAISAVRSSGAANDASTVDNADTVVGQIVAVQALEQQMNGHKPGSFGIQSNANTAGPSPAPTPSATASSSQKSSAKGK
ncbi:MAG TPA: copper transporter [Streptosporangiaceae bacterium]|nr:copper transporter [Streptosporangiaceae bacterium]